MSAMDIEHDLPIPPAYTSMVRNPFVALKVGDSISRPLKDQNSLRAAASQYKARHPGWHYVTRIEGDVIRLWRTAPPETQR